MPKIEFFEITFSKNKYVIITVDCPVGTYKYDDMTQCEMCPVGSVSKVDYDGRRYCSWCGEGMMSNPERTNCGECIGDLYIFLTREYYLYCKVLF